MSDPARHPKQRLLPEHTQDLRLDKRLIRRRGWIDAPTLEGELGSLPDVADKIRPPEEREEPAPAGNSGAEEGGQGGSGETTP